MDPNGLDFLNDLPTMIQSAAGLALVAALLVFLGTRIVNGFFRTARTADEALQEAISISLGILFGALLSIPSSLSLWVGVIAGGIGGFLSVVSPWAKKIEGLKGGERTDDPPADPPKVEPPVERVVEVVREPVPAGKPKGGSAAGDPPALAPVDPNS